MTADLGEGLRPGEIRIEGLGKRYWFRSAGAASDDDEATDDGMDDGDSAGGSVLSLLRGRRTEVWALRDISCHIHPGEQVGIIGANGSGKSTLCRVLSRSLPPSQGCVVGAGIVMPFGAMKKPISSDVSGCENLRMLARLLDIPLARLDERLSDIVQFSEIGQLAYEKVSRYSDKLFQRLSMAMALLIDADIYLVDDSVSPGDDVYRQKFEQRFAAALQGGSTLIYATNSVAAVRRQCRRALWLHNGQLVGDGEAGTVIDRFLSADRVMAASPRAEGQQAGSGAAAEALNGSPAAVAAAAGGDRLDIMSDWLVQAGKAEQRWKRQIQRWRNDNEPAVPDSQSSTIEPGPGRIGKLLSHFCLDKDGEKADRCMPGEDVTLELWIETLVEKVTARVQLEFHKDGIHVFTSEPLVPLDASNPGKYVLRAEVEGGIFLSAIDDCDCDFIARVHFAGAEPRQNETTSASVGLRLAGDGSLQANASRKPRRDCSVPSGEPQDGQSGGNGKALPKAARQTAVMPVGQQNPVLRPRLPWMVYVMHSAEQELSHEPAADAALEQVSS